MPKLIKKYRYSLLTILLIGGLVVVLNFSVAAEEIKKPELPALKIKSVPETVQPGAEIALTAEHTNFAQENMFTNWCIDGAPLNSFYAGSTDVVTLVVMDGDGKEYPEGSKIIKRKAKDEEEVFIERVVESKKNNKMTREEIKVKEARYVPKIQNEWGRLYGGTGFCDYPFDYMAKEKGYNSDFVLQAWFSGSQAASFKNYGKSGYEPDGYAPTIVALIAGVGKVPFISPPLSGNLVPAPSYSEPAEKNDKLEDPLGKGASKAYENTKDQNGKNYAYRDLDTDDISKYTEKMKEKGYDVVCVAGSDKNKSRCVVKESFVYVKISEVQDKVKEFEKKDMKVDIDWGSRGQIKEKKDGKDITSTTVKLRLWSYPAQGSTNVDKFKDYWKDEFGTPPSAQETAGKCGGGCNFSSSDLSCHYGEPDSNGLCTKVELFGSSKVAPPIPATAYDYLNRIYLKYRKSTWQENRWRTGLKNGKKVNRYATFRVFSKRGSTETTDQYKDGDIRGGGADKGLPIYSDQDDDGLPDLWEMRYFGSLAGKEVKKPGSSGSQSLSTSGSGSTKREVTGRVYFPPCCTVIKKGDAESKKKSDKEVSDFLVSVLPNDDWDADGFDWTLYKDREANWFPAEWSAGLGPAIERTKVPDATKKGKDNYAGDKVFTNYEEFVAGTNPIKEDTDGDGIPDELDFYGLDQASMKIKLNKVKSGGDYTVTARTYGKTTRGSYKNERSYYRTDAKKVMKEGGGLGLQVKLAVTPGNVTVNDDIVVKAAVGNIQNVDADSLFYRWYLNGFKVRSVEGEAGKYSDKECPCTPEAMSMANALGEQSGFGKDSFKFAARYGSNQPCVGIKVMLEVTDPKTDQTSIAQTEIPVLMDANFIKTVSYNKNEKNKAGKNATAPDKSKSSVDPKKGLRQGDTVEYKVKLDGYNEAACGVASGAKSSPGGDTTAYQNEYMKDLVYRWNVDGVDRKNKSGKGLKFQKLDVEATASGRMTPKNRGSSTADATEKDDHYVEVKVYDSKNKLVAHKREGIKILKAFVELKPTKNSIENILKKKPTDKSGKTTYSAKKGDKVKIKASAQYYKPAQGQKFTYTWYRNDKELPKSPSVTERVAELEYTAGDDKSSLKEDKFKVVIASLDKDGKTTMESNEGEITITVVDDSQGGLAGPKSFIEGFIPDSIRNVFNVFITLSVAALVMVFAFGFVGVSGRGRD